MKRVFYVFYWEAIFFIICYALSLFLATRVLQDNSFLGQNFTFPQLDWWWLLFYFAGVTLFILILMKIPKGLVILYILLVVWLGIMIFSIFLPSWLAWLLTSGLVLFWFFVRRVWVSNLFMIGWLVLGGVILGLIVSPWGLVILLGIISIYDIVAVHKIGHMQKMAVATIKSQTIFGFISPTEKASDFWATLKEVETDFKELLESKNEEEEKKPQRFTFLGGGDIGLPLIFVISVFAHYGFFSTLIVAGFVLLGLFSARVLLTLIRNRWKQRAMAALPPITLFSLIGFLIVHFFLK